MKLSFVFCYVFLLMNAALAQQKIDLSGTVTDKGGKPLKAASVVILNTERGAVTNDQGYFELNQIAPGRYTLQVSAIGYTTISEVVDLLVAKVPLKFVLNNDASSLDAVVVTAQKREEQLQKVPVSVTALSSRQVKEYRLWNARDLTAITPNYFSSHSGDERNIAFIRGIGTTSYDPAIATYIDGVNQFSLDTYSSQLADIERIEVLRGPQGTLYGRNAMGGVVNIITKQPTNTPTAFAEASIGNYHQQRYELGLRSPLVKDKLYLGASWLYSGRDGYYDNAHTNKSFDNQKIFAGNYYLKFKPSDAWNITFNLRHQAHRNDGAFPLGQFSAVKEAIDNGYTLQQNAKGEMIDNSLFSSLSVNYAGRGFSFSSQTAYQSNYRYYKNPVDGDFSPLDIVTIINNYGSKWNNVKTWTQDFKFTSAASLDKKLQWTAGTFLYADDRPTRQATHYGADAGFYGLPEVNFSTINTTTGTGAGIAFYGQVTYAITKKLDLTAGLRYDYEQKKYHVLGEYQKDGEQAFVTVPDTSASVHYGAFSPKAGLTWHLGENNHLFAVYSRGFRTGGLSQLSSDPSQPPLHGFKPEYSNNFELGVKNSFFGNKLTANLSVFYTTVTDMQVPTLVLPDAIIITRNAGKMESKGGELEVAATPVKGLQLHYNFGYTHAVYRRLMLPEDDHEVNLKGNRQIYTPEYTSMLAAQYSMPLGGRQQLKLVFRGEWLWMGRQYFDLGNQFAQDPYSLLNARVGVAGKNAELMFWGRNLGGKHYVSYAYDFGAMHMGDPKTFGVTLSVRI